MNERLFRGVVLVLLGAALLFSAADYLMPPVQPEARNVNQPGQYGSIQIQHGYLQVSDTAPSITQGQGTGFFEGAVEIDGELEADGAIDADSSLDVDGTTNLDDLDIDLSAELEIDGGLTDFGGCTAGVANGDNDVCIAAVLEVDGELEADGAIDADSTSNFADTATFSKGSGNAIVVSSGGAIDANGNLDVDGTSNLDEVDIDGITNVVVGTEHIGIPTVHSVAITYTAASGGSGTVATIADGEIWLIHDILVNCTTEFTTTAGDDEALIIGDGNDTDGFLVLDHTDLTTTYNEGVTGHAAGWLGKIEANVGVYFDPDGTDGFHNNTFVYAPSGAAETIDWALTCTDNDCTAGAATIYVIYTRIQ